MLLVTIFSCVMLLRSFARNWSSDCSHFWPYLQWRQNYKRQVYNYLSNMHCFGLYIFYYCFFESSARTLTFFGCLRAYYTIPFLHFESVLFCEGAARTVKSFACALYTPFFIYYILNKCFFVRAQPELWNRLLARLLHHSFTTFLISAFLWGRSPNCDITYPIVRYYMTIFQNIFIFK